MAALWPTHGRVVGGVSVSPRRLGGNQHSSSRPSPAFLEQALPRNGHPSGELLVGYRHERRRDPERRAA